MGEAAPGLLVGRDLVVGPARLQGREDVVGAEHARQDRVVAALDARHVHEAGRVAHEAAAGEATGAAPTASRPP